MILALGSMVCAMDSVVTDLKKIQNEKVVITLDLHEVAFDRSYSKFVGALYTFFKKNPLYNLSLINPVCAYRIFSVLSTTKTAENVYNVLAKKYYPDLEHTRSEFYALCNMYNCNPEMLQLIKELKQNGYRIAVCSNIGKNVCNDLSKDHAPFFDHCDVIVTSEPEDNYLRKPAPAFFDKFKKRCYDHFDSDDLIFFFVDDKEKNIKAAEQCGIHGCHFKNVIHFREYLQNQGINISYEQANCTQRT